MNDDKGTDSPTPEEEPVEEPEFSNDDLKKESLKDIASNKELPEDKPEEEPEETKETEETKVEPEETKDEVEIDPDKMAEDIANKVEEKMAKKQVDKVEVVEEVKDKYAEFFEQTQKEKGRDPNWREVAKFIEEQTRESIKKEQEETQRIAEEQKEAENKANEEFSKRLLAQVDEELEELYKSKKLAPIKDKNDPNDLGVVERKALFQTMVDVNEKRAAEGKTAIVSVSRIFYGGYYEKPNVQPAGADAPISMGKGSQASSEGEQELDYAKDIHKPWNVFKRPKADK